MGAGAGFWGNGAVKHRWFGDVWPPKIHMVAAGLVSVNYEWLDQHSIDRFPDLDGKFFGFSGLQSRRRLHKWAQIFRYLWQYSLPLILQQHASLSVEWWPTTSHWTVGLSGACEKLRLPIEPIFGWGQGGKRGWDDPDMGRRTWHRTRSHVRLCLPSLLARRSLDVGKLGLASGNNLFRYIHVLFQLRIGDSDKTDYVLTSE